MVIAEQTSAQEAVAPPDDDDVELPPLLLAPLEVSELHAAAPHVATAAAKNTTL